MFKKVYLTLTIATVITAMVLNINYAINGYGIKTISLHPEVLAQTSSSGGGTGTGTSTSGGGSTTAGEGGGTTTESGGSTSNSSSPADPTCTQCRVTQFGKVVFSCKPDDKESCTSPTKLGASVSCAKAMVCN